VHLGKENLWELSERAQLLALDLKSCCQLLYASEDNRQEFLQCKATARRYETNVDAVVSQVQAAIVAETAQLADKLGAATRGIAEAVAAARATSKTFSERVVEIRKEQAMARLDVLPPQHVEVEAQERESNDDILTTNVVELGIWITGGIGHPSDDDFYTFTLPNGPRDIFRVELENHSTTLEPELHYYDSRKSHTRGLSNGTTGADLSYEFVAEPGSRHHLQVRNDDRATTGAYLLRIAPRNAYDAFEPNDTVL